MKPFFMDPKKMEELKRKFYDGACTPEELALLEEWMMALPDADTGPLNEAGEQQMEKALWSRIRQQTIAPATKVPVVRRSNVILWRSLAAACVLLLVASGIYWYSGERGGAEVTWITVAASPGSIEKVVLPDQSVVWLNAATTLQYPARFDGTRKVILKEGEAFFEVTHDPSRPFIVEAPHLETEVLGTSFSVKAYRSLPVTKVKVATGRVSVRDRARVLDHVLPNEQLTYRVATGNFQKESVAADEIMGWRSRQLVFHRASFDEIALSIENRYQVKIHYNQTDMEHLQLTFKGSPEWTLEQVLDMLTTLSNTRYTLKEKHVTIQLNP
jgi:ferric-dicitrate binding protein FerR (iron transport regulator)